MSGATKRIFVLLNILFCKRCKFKRQAVCRKFAFAAGIRHYRYDESVMEGTLMLAPNH